MDLTIIAPTGLLCQTTTDKVSFPGEWGAFTVLTGHAPLIAHLVAGTIVYSEQGQEKSLEIESGFVRVLENQLEVCVEVPGHDIS